MNVNVFIGVGGGGTLGFTEKGGLFFRGRLGTGKQVGASVIQTPVPSRLDERLPNGFALLPFGFFAEGAVQGRIPGTPFALDISLFTFETGLAKPPPGDGPAIPFLDVRPHPAVEGGTLGGFNLGASAGIEFLFVGGGDRQ